MQNGCDYPCDTTGGGFVRASDRDVIDVSTTATGIGWGGQRHVLPRWVPSHKYYTLSTIASLVFSPQFSGYDAYMDNAFPADELMPLSCQGRFRGVQPDRGDLDDALGKWGVLNFCDIWLFSAFDFPSGYLKKFKELGYQTTRVKCPCCSFWLCMN